MKLPQPPASYDASNERQTRGQLERADKENFKKGQDVELARDERLILRSPNGTRFVIAVDNAGTITATSL